MIENLHVLAPLLLLVAAYYLCRYGRRWGDARAKERKNELQASVRRAEAVTQREYSDRDRAAYEARENRRAA